jgi:DNA mismatch repair protein MutS
MTQFEALTAQYNQIKREHPDVLLLIRCGDFYEAIGQDADTIEKALDICPLTRADGTKVAGVPCHSINRYLARLIEAGHRVAICDQMLK